MTALLMSINSFSQTGYNNNIKVITDSIGTHYLAFTVKDLDIIKKDLLVGDINKNRVKELNNKLSLIEEKFKTQEAISDSLDEQIKIYIDVTVNKDGQIEAKEKEIKDLKLAIGSLEMANFKADTIMAKDSVIIQSQKNKIKHKNRTITGLITIDVIIIVLVFLIAI